MVGVKVGDIVGVADVAIDTVAVGSLLGNVVGAFVGAKVGCSDGAMVLPKEALGARLGSLLGGFDRPAVDGTVVGC